MLELRLVNPGARADCRGRSSECGTRHFRYSSEVIHLGWSPTLDRWANSFDWCADAPEAEAAAVRRGGVGDRNERHDYEAVTLMPPAGGCS